MLFLRMMSGGRQPRLLDWQGIKLILAALAIVFIITQLWLALVDRMAARYAPPAAITSAPVTR
jgi:hypothetical protein